MTILHISDDVFMELPKGYGSWKVGSIYDLGQEEKPQIGSNLLKLSISKLVGLPIDGLIIQKDLSQPSVEDLVGGWRKNPFNRLTFLRSISTDLTPIELYKFIKSSSSVRPDQITSLNLAQSNITRSQLLPDSSRVLGVDTIKLDTFIRDNISDPTLSEEDLTLAIFNATPHPGLAQQAQRIMTNLGMNVIILANTEKVLEIMANNDGRISQKELRKELLPLSEAKVSLIITELEHLGKIEKIKKGRGNVLILRNEEKKIDQP